MSNLPKGAIPFIETFNKKDTLIGIKRRFNNEIGVIINLISNYNGNSSGVIGFWAELRLMFPVIETISKVCQIDLKEFIKDKLNILTPNLFWDMYRHSLTHNDWLYIAKMKDRIIDWGITLGSSNHMYSKQTIIIDPSVLYKSIDDFLAKEISETDDKQEITLCTGVEYIKEGFLNKKEEIITPSKEIIKEFEIIEKYAYKN